MSGNYVNREIAHVDAVDKVTGQLEYISDLRLPNMLFGKILRSPHPHAKIVKINAAKALALPGVKAVLTPEDVVNRVHVGPFIEDWEALPWEKVRYIGQEVAAVAAVSEKIAEEAAGLVEIEYQLLPPVFDMMEAMKPDAPLLYEAKGSNVVMKFYSEHGDVDAAFAGSAFVREIELSTSVAFHAYIECNGCICRYEPADGKYTMWASTQSPYKARSIYAKSLGIDTGKLRLIQAPMGGGFGGKFEANMHIVTAYLAKKAGGTVRIMNTLEEEFSTAPLRVPMKIRTKMGIDKEGRITAKETVVYGDNGGRSNAGSASISSAAYRPDNLYKMDVVRDTAYLMYTNNPPKGAMRGFGNPQGLLAVEALLDMLADDAGIDPGQIRIINSPPNGHVSIHGWEIGSCGLPECVQTAQKASNWDKREKPEGKTGKKRRGIGLACCNHVAGARMIWRPFDGANAVIKTGPDGNFVLFIGETEVGQGLKTVITQIAAEALSVPIDWIELMPPDSYASVVSIGSMASRGTVMCGNAVLDAARNLRAVLIPELEKLFQKEPGGVDLVKGRIIETAGGAVLGDFKEAITRITDSYAGKHFVGSGSFKADTVFPDDNKYGNLSPNYSFACHIAEVEVDTETGKVDIVGYNAANDVGHAINPLLCRGQIEGGVVQGAGWALTEQVIMDEGKVLNKNFLDYKLPSFMDMVDVTPHLVEEPDPKGPFGAKSLGEPAFNPVAAAICNAIYNAAGVRILKLPASPDYVLSLLKEKNKSLPGGESK